MLRSLFYPRLGLLGPKYHVLAAEELPSRGWSHKWELQSVFSRHGAFLRLFCQLIILVLLAKPLKTLEISRNWRISVLVSRHYSRAKSYFVSQSNSTGWRGDLKCKTTCKKVVTRINILVLSPFTVQGYIHKVQRLICKFADSREHRLTRHCAKI